MKKKKRLVRQLGNFFVVFALGTILVSGITTYVNRTQSYHRECVTRLEQLTAYLSGQIQRDATFPDLIAYFKEHKDLVQIPRDFDKDLPLAQERFENYMMEHGGKVSGGSSLKFDDLDDEAKRLYVIYRMEYWFNVFFSAAEDFQLSYVYFIFPVEGADHTMNYMFDPVLETVTTDDGAEILDLGIEVYEDPAQHKYMWKAWESGKAPDGFDQLDNEFGHVYTYCAPVSFDGEKAGLVCAEISVENVRGEIVQSVMRQVILLLIVLALATIALFYLLRIKVFDRILHLEKNVESYTENKDPEITAQIVAQKGADDEIGSLADRFSGMITELNDYMINLEKVTAEKQRIGAELNVATKIQADMLPRIFPQYPYTAEYELYATMSPAKEVGGDFYDFFQVDDTHLAMVMADVSGKGVPAALFMVIAKTLIQNRVRMGGEPGEDIRDVNDQLCVGNESNLFVTVWLAVLNLKTGQVLEINAGHEHPAIRRKDGQYELHRTKHSPALAIMEGMFFRQTEFWLEPGDSVFVYTDGVTEATNASNELFGEERLLEALNANAEKAPDALLPAVREAIDAFVQDAPQFDDITMMGLRYHGWSKKDETDIAEKLVPRDAGRL